MERKSAPKLKIRFWDDTDPDIKQTLISETITNVNLATVRFIRFMQSLEIKYTHHMDDNIKEMDHDGNLKFHLNNINGWHP